MFDLKVVVPSGPVLRNFTILSKIDKLEVLKWRNADSVRRMLLDTQKITIRNHLDFIALLQLPYQLESSQMRPVIVSHCAPGFVGTVQNSFPYIVMDGCSWRARKFFEFAYFYFFWTFHSISFDIA